MPERLVHNLILGPERFVEVSGAGKVELGYSACAEYARLYQLLVDEHKPAKNWQVKDFSLEWEGARWRVHLYHHVDGWSAVLRLLPAAIPSLSELGFDSEEFSGFLGLQGMILFCGAASMGKSTTLAAYAQFAGQKDARGVTVSIEEPVEFLYSDKLTTQREVGSDVPNFATGIHDALRAAVQTIIVGEVREREPAHAAVQAGLSGHQVLATVHANDVCQAVSRMYALLDSEHDELLPDALAGVVAQHLIPVGDGVEPLYETLLFDKMCRNALAESGVKNLNELRNAQSHQNRASLKIRAGQFLNRGVPRAELQPWLD